MDKEYLVLYTHQKSKKTKTWQDGILKVCRAGSKAVLFSDSGSKVDSVHVKTNQLNIGDEIESDRHLITIEEIKVNGRQEREPVENEVKSSDGVVNRDVRYGINPLVSQPERLNVNSAAVSRPLKIGLKRKRTEFIPPRLVKQQVLHSGINSPTATEACGDLTNHHTAIQDEKSSSGTNIFNLYEDHEVFTKNRNVQSGPYDAKCNNTEGNSNSVGSRAFHSPWSVIGQPRRPNLLETKEEGIRHEAAQSKKRVNNVSLPETGKRSAAQILKLIGGKPFKPPLKQPVKSVADDNIKEKIQEGKVNEAAGSHTKVHDNQYIALEGNDVTLFKTKHLLDDTVHCETSEQVQAVSETNYEAENDAAVKATEDVSISKSKGVSVAIEDYDIAEEDAADGYFDINFSPLSQVSDSEPDSLCSSETFNGNKLSQDNNVLVAKPFPTSSSNSETLGNHGCPKTMSSTSKHEVYFKSNTEDTVFECENNVKVEISNQLGDEDENNERTQFAKCSLGSTLDAEDTAVNKSASFVNFITLEDLTFSPGSYVGSFSTPTGTPQQQLHVGDSCIQNQTTLAPNQTQGCIKSTLKQEFDDSPVSIQKTTNSFPAVPGYRLVENTCGDDLVPSVNLDSDADTEQTPVSPITQAKERICAQENIPCSSSCLPSSRKSLFESKENHVTNLLPLGNVHGEQTEHLHSQLCTTSSCQDSPFEAENISLYEAEKFSKAKVAFGSIEKRDDIAEKDSRDSYLDINFSPLSNVSNSSSESNFPCPSQTYSRCLSDGNGGKIPHDIAATETDTCMYPKVVTTNNSTLLQSQQNSMTLNMGVFSKGHHLGVSSAGQIYGDSKARITREMVSSALASLPHPSDLKKQKVMKNVVQRDQGPLLTNINSKLDQYALKGSVSGSAARRVVSSHGEFSGMSTMPSGGHVQDERGNYPIRRDGAVLQQIQLPYYRSPNQMMGIFADSICQTRNCVGDYDKPKEDLAEQSLYQVETVENALGKMDYNLKPTVNPISVGSPLQMVPLYNLSNNEKHETSQEVPETSSNSSQESRIYLNTNQRRPLKSKPFTDIVAHDLYDNQDFQLPPTSDTTADNLLFSLPLPLQSAQTMSETLCPKLVDKGRNANELNNQNPSPVLQREMGDMTDIFHLGTPSDSSLTDYSFFSEDGSSMSKNPDHEN